MMSAHPSVVAVGAITGHLPVADASHVNRSRYEKLRRNLARSSSRNECSL
jgi:hypothetical protein